MHRWHKFGQHLSKLATDIAEQTSSPMDARTDGQTDGRIGVKHNASDAVGGDTNTDGRYLTKYTQEYVVSCGR